MSLVSVATAAMGFTATLGPSTHWAYQISEGSATSGGMQRPAPTSATSTGVSVDLLDAKLAAAEARTDTKFVQLLGKMDLIGEKISTLGTKLETMDKHMAGVEAKVSSAKYVIIATVVATGLSVAGLAYAAVQAFQGGMSLTTGAFAAGMQAATSAPPEAPVAPAAQPAK